jgi:succinate dehydrogenase / fumarate reductase cytochrome b subunit
MVPRFGLSSVAEHAAKTAQGGLLVPDTSAGSLAADPLASPKIRMPKRPAGTLYRGREGMWSWVLHRITGVAIYFFLLVHILDTALVRVSPEAYNAVISTYKTPIMGLGETALVAAIGLHALNGLRIILIDFWSVGTKHQRLMFYIVIALWIVLLVGFVPRQFMHIFGGGE